MDLLTIPNLTKFREIEDVIEIQKASGNINARQVSFLIPSDTESTISANVARSLDSGLTKIELKKRSKKLQRKIKSCRSLLPDVISWPSDSDITVLRMRLCMNNKLNEKVPGDGLHQSNSCSMVNLATLMLQSPQPSKHSIIEEMLFPLTSWEGTGLETKRDGHESFAYSYQNTSLTSGCSKFHKHKLSKTSECTNLDVKSKIARFFRLYFCPCCSCLYNMEKMRDEPSAYITKNTK